MSKIHPQLVSQSLDPRAAAAATELNQQMYIAADALQRVVDQLDFPHVIGAFPGYIRNQLIRLLCAAQEAELANDHLFQLANPAQEFPHLLPDCSSRDLRAEAHCSICRGDLR